MAREFIERYNYRFDSNTSDLEIEMFCIRMGGLWNPIRSRLDWKAGKGLEYHFERMRQIIWPELDTHRWHVLCRDNQIRSKVCVLMGPASSGKTHEAAWFRLCEYYVHAKDMCVLVSSTDLRGLELRIWGEIKMLHTLAKERFPELPGNMLESKHAIATDDIDEEEARDLRKGIIGIPCIQGGKYVGLGKYAGIKQKHVRLLADEAQFMGQSFLSAFANLDKNVDFRASVLGNPHDIMDPLGKAAEPIDGWSSHLEPKKTDVWKTRFMDGVCVNLIGTDSPNFDFPADQPAKFPYLISREKIANTLSFFTQDSDEFLSQCVGAMKIGVLLKRVVTRDLVMQFGARDAVVWASVETLIKIFCLDAAYGGDRCIGGHIEMGRDVNGRWILGIRPPQVVPVRSGSDQTPEDQIAEWIKEYCDTNEIPPENVFHDSTGRGGLGTAIARVFSADCNPLEFGGKPTPRPVSLDLYIYDPKEKRKRLKRCDEHYDRFVTELWWAIRLAIESRQLRGLPEDVMEELCMREYDRIKEHKIRIETKKEMKLRVGRSPDLADWLAIGVEGARRKGFQIEKLGNSESGGTSNQWDWLQEARDKAQGVIKAHALNHAA